MLDCSDDARALRLLQPLPGLAGTIEPKLVTQLSAR
jgi:hypothetical protein